MQDEESESGKLEDDLEKEACLGGKVRKIQRKDMVCLRGVNGDMQIIVF